MKKVIYDIISQIKTDYNISINPAMRWVTGGYTFKSFHSDGKSIFFPYSDSDINKMFLHLLHLLENTSKISTDDYSKYVDLFNSSDILLDYNLPKDEWGNKPINYFLDYEKGNVIKYEHFYSVELNMYVSEKVLQ